MSGKRGRPVSTGPTVTYPVRCKQEIVDRARAAARQEKITDRVYLARALGEHREMIVSGPPGEEQCLRLSWSSRIAALLEKVEGKGWGVIAIIMPAGAGGWRVQGIGDEMMWGADWAVVERSAPTPALEVLQLWLDARLTYRASAGLDSHA